MTTRELFEQHKDGAKELAIAMAIPAAAVFLLAMMLPEPEPQSLGVQFAVDRAMPTTEPERVWT